VRSPTGVDFIGAQVTYLAMNSFQDASEPWRIVPQRWCQHPWIDRLLLIDALTGEIHLHEASPSSSGADDVYLCMQ